MSRANLPIVIGCVLVCLWFGARSGWAAHANMPAAAVAWANKTPEQRIDAVATSAAVPVAEKTGWTSYTYLWVARPMDAKSTAEAFVTDLCEQQVKAGQLLKYRIEDLTQGRYLILRQGAGKPAQEITK